MSGLSSNVTRRISVGLSFKNDTMLVKTSFTLLVTEHVLWHMTNELLQPHKSRLIPRYPASIWSSMLLS